MGSTNGVSISRLRSMAFCNLQEMCHVATHLVSAIVEDEWDILMRKIIEITFVLQICQLIEVRLRKYVVSSLWDGFIYEHLILHSLHNNNYDLLLCFYKCGR